MKVIDFHTHILPEIDDGSQSLEQSLEMLRLEKQSGIDVVVMTPHFYAEQDRLDAFLSRRENALERVKEATSRSDQYPSIQIGAEVRYFPGISKANGLEKLRIIGTELLLLELPFTQWDETILNEVEYLTTRCGFNVILAHIEYYLHFQKNRRFFNHMLKLPIIGQCNVGPLLHRKRGLSLFHRNDQDRLIVNYFRNGRVYLLGSDCHSLKDRAPNLAAGREVLAKQLNPAVLQKIDEFGSRLLQLDTQLIGNEKIELVADNRPKLQGGKSLSIDVL